VHDWRKRRAARDGGHEARDEGPAE
jgi:hypothetical protein